VVGGGFEDRSRISELVKLILSQDGVDINRMAECGETALSLAVNYDFLEAADILRAHGAV
jgi:ankyrin repeat protein